MTCIVGIVDKKTKRVVIGGDSASTSGENINTRKDPKVFKNGEFAIGCTGSFRMMQLLRFSFKPPEIKSKDIYEYMCTDFINEVRECFKKGGFLQKYTEGDEKGGKFLVAYKNKLFQIQDDFQVGESLDGIEICGCATDFASGALFVLSKQNIPTGQKVIKALEAAEYLSPFVRRPFVLINT